MRKPDGTYTERPDDTLDYLLVAPVQGNEYNKLFDGWFWDEGTVLLYEAVLNSAIRGYLVRAPGMDGIISSMLQEGWAVLALIFHKFCMGCLRLGIIPCRCRETSHLNTIGEEG